MLRYEKRVVVFLDILGFRGIVQATINEDGTDNRPALGAIKDALEHIRWLLFVDPTGRERVGFREYIYPRCNITQFSDSIVLSFPVPRAKDDSLVRILHALKVVLIRTLEHGVLMRGAAGVGKLIHDEQLLFGPGLIRCYDLETTQAVFPRVILDGSITHKRGVTRDLLGQRVLAEDSDGFFYIDYFAYSAGCWDYRSQYPEHLSLIRELVTSGLAIKNKRVREKYGWMRLKYNALIEAECDDAKTRSLLML